MKKIKRKIKKQKVKILKKINLLGQKRRKERKKR